MVITIVKEVALVHCYPLKIQVISFSLQIGLTGRQLYLKSFGFSVPFLQQ